MGSKSVRARRRFYKKTYSFSSMDPKLVEEFKTCISEEQVKAFLKKHKRYTKGGKGYVRRNSDKYETIEPCIRKSASGSYQVRVGLKGMRYEKICKSLKEAREFRDAVKKEGRKLGGHSYKESNCQKPRNLDIGKKVKFIYNEEHNRLEIHYWSGKEFRHVIASPSKVKELRDSLNGIIRRTKSETKRGSKEAQRQLTIKQRKERLLNGEQPDLF